jgi:hypothetical protein
VERRIQELQDQLHGHSEPGEPHDSKQGIMKQIQRINKEELAPAMASLRKAQHALEICQKKVREHD